MKRKFIKNITINNVNYSVYVINCDLVDDKCICDNINHTIYINAKIFENGSYNDFMFSMLGLVLRIYFNEYKKDYMNDNLLINFLQEKLFDIFDNIYDNDLIGRIEDKFKNSEEMQENSFNDYFIDNILIMGVDYKILLTKSNILHNVLGQSNNLEKIILIDYKCFNENKLKETLFHEFLHCYFYECSLYCYNNEDLVVFLENIFFKIINYIWDFNFLIKVEKVSNKFLKVG